MTKKLNSTSEFSMKEQIKILKVELKQADEVIVNLRERSDQNEKYHEERYQKLYNDFIIIKDIRELSEAKEKARSIKKLLDEFYENQKVYTMHMMVWALTVVVANIAGGILVYALLK